jgi:hypothetical protein
MVEFSDKCPMCGSPGSYDGAGVSWFGNTGYIDWWCGQCKAEWTNHYELTHVTIKEKEYDDDLFI